MDASAGTGKTYTLGQRYQSLRENGVPPDELFFVTFTENGADEMNERLDPDEETFIGTFHSMAKRIFDRHGTTDPLDFEGDYSDPTLVSDELTKTDLFADFFESFRSDHYEDNPILGLYDEPGNALELIERMASRGVFPTETGWYKNGADLLDGDESFFEDRLQTVNEPNEGSRGPTQSDLRRSMSRYRNQRFDGEAPAIDELRGGRGSKQVDESLMQQAFETDRSDLKQTVHRMYRSYLRHQIENDYTTFSTLQGWAYVTLAEQKDLRESLRRDHVLIDEFQDTSPLQFKMGLMLCDEKNLCVVGDYKQSIYSFQYADVENLKSFPERINRFADQLEDRTIYDSPVDVNRVSLDVQYRNAPSIRETAHETLRAPATQRDSPDQTTYKSMPMLQDEGPDQGTVRTLEAPDEDTEYERIVESIRADVEDSDPSDVAVLTRTRSVARDLYTELDESDVPVAYEGGVNVFDNDFGRRALAWLRVIHEEDSVRGWAALLEDEGYGLEEVQSRLRDEPDVPDDLLSVRENFQAAFDESPRVFLNELQKTYDPNSDLVDTIQGLVESNEDMIQRDAEQWADYIHRSIDEDQTVDPELESDGAVRVMTVHSAKGSEFERVYVAGMNDHTFPSRARGGSGPIQFNEEFGLRADRTIVREDGKTYPAREWSTWVLDRMTSGQYDEERRLLYVACTRAQDELTVTAHEPSPFFDTIEETADESITLDEPMESDPSNPDEQLPLLTP